MHISLLKSDLGAGSQGDRWGSWDALGGSPGGAGPVLGWVWVGYGVVLGSFGVGHGLILAVHREEPSQLQSLPMVSGGDVWHV